MAGFTFEKTESISDRGAGFPKKGDKYIFKFVESGIDAEKGWEIKGVRVANNEQNGSITLMLPMEIVAKADGSDTEFAGRKLDKMINYRTGDGNIAKDVYAFEEGTSDRIPQLYKWLNMILTALPEADQNTFNAKFGGQPASSFMTNPEFASFVAEKFPNAYLEIEIDVVKEKATKWDADAGERVPVLGDDGEQAEYNKIVIAKGKDKVCVSRNPMATNSADAGFDTDDDAF